MARRKTSRVTALVLAAAAALAVAALAIRGRALHAGATTRPGDVVLHADQPGPRLDDGGNVGQLAQPKPVALLVRHDDDAAATPPATKPVDGGAVLYEATKLREGGDLVTARDRANAAIVGGGLAGADLVDAKAFAAELNAKIILGTQKFPADASNKTWKVEPGTALWKLAKRFDVTAELLCRVNGLKDASKLRAGVTIKAIQGPFHLVVNKGQFTADVYLGDAGGPGATYVKTFRVGLGSDSSTPTGTWLVDAGKVVNPVFNSSRGEGQIGADDPKNPIGERWLPLKGVEGKCVGQESYGIHGTIDPDSIGKNMSQGCIRLGDADIVELYDLLVEGKSKVRVVD